MPRSTPHRISPRSASTLHAELDRNVNRLYEGTISQSEFNRRQLQAWDRIRQAGVEDQVLARIRSELPAAPGRAEQAPMKQMEREIRAVASPRRPRRR